MSVLEGAKGFRIADLSLTTCVVVEDQKEILQLIYDTLRILNVGHVIPLTSAEALIDFVTRVETSPNSVGLSNVDFAIVDWNLTGDAFKTLKSSDPVEAESELQEGEEEGEENPCKNYQGSNVVQWLRNNEFTHFMPILGLSAYASAKVITGMRDAGANSFVSKPFTVNEIARHIQRIVQDIKPHIVTPSGYFGPDRRRVSKPVDEDRRRSQGGVKSFTPPRTLRNKTSNQVEVEEVDVAKIMLQMQEIAPPDFVNHVQNHVDNIQSSLKAIRKEPQSDHEIEVAREMYDSIDFMCNDILSHAGCFSYQMVAEAFSGISRFIGDPYFVPTLKAFSLIEQQIATAKLIARHDMRGPTTPEMRKVFAASLDTMEKVLQQNRNKR